MSEGSKKKQKLICHCEGVYDRGSPLNYELVVRNEELRVGKAHTRCYVFGKNVIIQHSTFHIDKWIATLTLAMTEVYYNIL